MRRNKASLSAMGVLGPSSYSNYMGFGVQVLEVIGTC